VAHYATTQWALAVLHAGFPVVAYFYTLMMHAPRRAERPAAPAEPPLTVIDSTPAPVALPAPAPDSTVTVAVSKTARVKALAAERGWSESKAWREVRQGREVV